MIRIIAVRNSRKGATTSVDLTFQAEGTNAGALDICIELTHGMSPDAVAEKLRTAAMYVEAMRGKC